jgi:hypothetical protein
VIDRSQLYSIIYAKDSVKARMRELAVAEVKTGFDTEYGNKVCLFRACMTPEAFVLVASSRFNVARHFRTSY